MAKTRNTLLIFLLILLQSLLAISAGIAALFHSSQKTVPGWVSVGELAVGGMSYQDAIKVIETDYEEKFKDKSLLIKINNERIYEIPFSQIDMAVDSKATTSKLNVLKGIKDIPNYLYACFGYNRSALRPVIKFDEGELRQALQKLSEEIYIAPKDAEISYRDGIIDKKVETYGVKLNVTNAVNVIREQLTNDPSGTVSFSSDENFELQAVEPDKKIKDYDDIQQAFSSYSTRIIDEELADSIRFAAEAINGVVLPAASNNENSSVFSFVECLASKDAGFTNDNDGYDQVASTLYAALLLAGLPMDSITRLQHELTVDYIEPGLDAWISSDAGDLKFSNPFSHKMAIFAQLEGNSVKVVIAGSISDKKEEYEIKTEVVQKFDPPVFYIENKSLKPGERVILNPGKEGIMVEVFRNGELIDTNKYEAEKTIVQTGPETGRKEDEK